MLSVSEAKSSASYKILGLKSLRIKEWIQYAPGEGRKWPPWSRREVLNPTTLDPGMGGQTRMCGPHPRPVRAGSLRMRETQQLFSDLPGDLSQCAVGVRTPQSRQTSGFKIYLISVFQRNLQSPGKSILRQTKQINRYPHGQLYSVKDYLLHIYGKPRMVLSAMKYP